MHFRFLWKGLWWRCCLAFILHTDRFSFTCVTYMLQCKDPYTILPSAKIPTTINSNNSTFILLLSEENTRWQFTSKHKHAHTNILVLLFFLFLLFKLVFASASASLIHVWASDLRIPLLLSSCEEKNLLQIKAKDHSPKFCKKKKKKTTRRKQLGILLRGLISGFHEGNGWACYCCCVDPEAMLRKGALLAHISAE